MATSSARTPQVLVLVNGSAMPGIVDVEIASNNHLGADRFSITASLAVTGYDVWAGDILDLEVRVAVAGNWTSLIYGQTDQVEIDLGRGEVRVDGRDLTSRFIEARIEDSFENQTASDIANMLAQRRGLQAVVTPTTSIVGRDFENSYSRVTLDQHTKLTTEWDLLTHLAEGEGFDVWIDGQSLYFAPPDQSASVLSLTPQDCSSIRLQRLVTLSAGLAVRVRSWDCRGQMSVEQTATSKIGSDPPRTYVVVKPNLSAGGAQIIAQRLLTQMAQNERCVIIEMPGDVVTRPRDILALTGSGTDFDGIWTISSIERRLSFQHGFTQAIEARMPAWTAF